ncbi:uncharacterized protein CXQ87_001955 [Candidozyma duobushaemuli]|uniref:Mitochondrial carrier n=2 Tax=Candidozyma TaxID=3303203 RepID=A0ABX8I3T8_9ASCO|nr:uncharacterized protein CXQ87_001955 [[Candida] duobushaemulonis]PVH13837.1 hypothetical protein CXQ87_001955 [[Candida] duobushaemulonis]QWU87934.1 hypothetical protein CA3LBN_002199 [[Candida] haemuloni]
MSLSSELAAAIEDEDLHLHSPGALPKTPGPPTNSDITAVQRMLSACSGSFITSLVVTPFDVVRIRVQQQEVMQGFSCCSQSTPKVAMKPPPSASKASFSSAASTLSRTAAALQPPGVFWVTGHYCEAAEVCPKITSTFQGMSVISRNEGITTLWRGLSLTLFMAIPSNIIYFTGYEYIRDRSPFKGEMLNPLLCGSFARTMAATVVAPVELLKTRLQSIPHEVRNDQPRSQILKNLLKDLSSSFKTRGIGSMFTGLKITLWRDVPFSGIYWSCYELFKDRIGGAMEVDFAASHQDDWKVFTTSFLSGSMGGVVAAAFTNPFDVGKTRLQIATEQRKPSTKPSMFSFLQQIYRNEGLGALYSGFGPRVMKIAPSCAIMISSYEIGKKIFKDSM